jgi:hypothetical protein
VAQNRQRTTRLGNLAFLVFFGIYTAGVIVWLAFGIPPVLEPVSEPLWVTGLGGGEAVGGDGEASWAIDP